MKRTSAAMLAAGLILLFGLSARAYWIQHRLVNDLSTPEQFLPAPDGSRPGPANPPAPVTLEILPLPPGGNDDLIEAAARAVSNWDLVAGSALNLSISTPGPGDLYDPGWADRYYNEDGRNTIEFIMEGWPDFLGPNVIAMTVPHARADGAIAEVDIFCNVENFRWEAFEKDGYFPGLAAERWVDAESILTHELGHVAGLGHSQKFWASMYYLPGLADTRARLLTSDDERALRFQYPAREEDVPPPSPWAAAADTFADGQCGASFISLLSYPVYFDERIIITSPEDPSIPLCVFGSGFYSDRSIDMDLSRARDSLGQIDGEETIAPNFARGIIRNEEGGYDILEEGSYNVDMYYGPGEAGSLLDGFIKNPAGNDPPTAIIEADRDVVGVGRVVRLSGEGSFDPDGADLSYSWSVVESPGEATAILDSSESATVKFKAIRQGLFVIRLSVNDGSVSGIADQVLIRVTNADVVSGGEEDFNPWGCWIGEAPGRSWLICLVPFVLVTLARVLSLFQWDRKRPRSG